MWGPQGGFQGESCRLRVFSFVPVEPSNLGRAAEKGRWGGEGTQQVGRIRGEPCLLRACRLHVVIPLLA